ASDVEAAIVCADHDLGALERRLELVELGNLAGGWHALLLTLAPGPSGEREARGGQQRGTRRALGPRFQRSPPRQAPALRHSPRRRLASGSHEGTCGLWQDE